MVMPAGLEPDITSLRGLRPDQLDEGTVLEIRVGFEPTNNSFAGCPLKPLEYRIMGIRAGLEPVIATVKGLCPNHLDERTICRDHSPCVRQPYCRSPEYHLSEHAALLQGQSNYLPSATLLQSAICKSLAGN